MSQQETSRPNDLLNFVRGFCMGAADSVPGVSGGTIALILGHYFRLVTAISRFDSTAIKLLKAGHFRELSVHLDFRFLCGLGSGIVVALLTLAGLMHWLLEHKMPETLAVFLGLILASVWIVAKQIQDWSIKTIALLVLFAFIGFGISSLSPMGVQPSLGFLFLAAVVAICAMILPGISGSFILVVFGVYHHVTGLIKGIPRGDITTDVLIQITVFVAGCAVGLGAFSRVLRWLIQHHQNTTFAALLGLMIGSLKRVWPLQQATTESVGKKFSEREFIFISPTEWPTAIWPLITLTVIAAIAVIFMEAVGARNADRAIHNSE